MTITQEGPAIPGYDYGSPSLPRSPVTPEDLARLAESVGFGAADRDALRRAGGVLAGQVEQILDVWYGFVAGRPHLLAAFCAKDGQPVAAYLDRVRARFGQWILDTCRRPYDQAWLDYADLIGRRHAPVAKNQADAASAAPVVRLRDLIALAGPVSATIRPFLAADGADAAEVEARHEAWRKSVLLQVALWARAYVPADVW